MVAQIARFRSRVRPKGEKVNVSSSECIRTTRMRVIADWSRFTTGFKDHLFAREPSLLRVFPSTTAARDAAVLALLDGLMASLDSAVLGGTGAEMMATRFADIGLQPRHYGVVGQALLAALADELGPDFTDEVHGAWADAYVRIAETAMAARYNRFDLVA